MLARKLKITLNGLEVGTTPMLVPSVSSRTNIHPIKILETISFIYGPILISAYDCYHANGLNISFPPLIFLDSGGYECNKNEDISDIGLYKAESKKWDENLHSDVIDKWTIKTPTVLISYDNPLVRESIEKQIIRANNLFKDKDDFLKEFLIKPKTKNAQRVKPEDVIKNLNSFSSFDILGFTEKELGYSVLDRMTNLAKIRMAMDDEDIKKPIHIFGSLDPITTPLYYISGADIFDGLSWLRFIFHNGNAFYGDSFGPKHFGIHENSNVMWGKSLSDNYTYLMRLQLDLEKFQSNGDFDVFGSNAEFFEKSLEDLTVKIGGDFNGR